MFIVLGILIVLFSFLFPVGTKAEIATTRDWVGLFAVGEGNRKTDTVNDNTWAYTSNCTQTVPAPNAIPKLALPDGCTLQPNPPAPSGSYELRLYAYDYSNDADPNDASALIAVSALAASTPNPSPNTNCPAQIDNPRVRDGLISAPRVGYNFGNPTATCVVGNQASFEPFEITYGYLKSQYFDQAILPSSNLFTLTNPAPQNSGTSPINLSTISGSSKLYHVTGEPGNLTINSNITPLNETGMIFVDGNLTIGPISGNKLTHSNENAGLVFVVKGNIVIDPSITQIDAVLIAEGKIYTAGDGCLRNSTSANPLVINGSLITLSNDKNVEFCRVLADNNTPSEKIIQQPKYLVILRNILSTTLQKWSEIE